MRIFYCVRSLEAVPSCMYNIRMLNDAGYIVVPVLGRSTTNLNNVLKQCGIDFFDSSSVKTGNKFLDFFRLTAGYRNSIKMALKEYKKDDLIILGTADSAIYLRSFYRDKRFILCLKELHEDPWYYPMILKKLSKKAAGIICCEKNRARVLQSRWNLKKRPYVISNKPYGYPTERCIAPSSEQTGKIIELIQGKEIIIYQAKRIYFTDELINLVKALKMLDSELMLVLIGQVVNEADREKIISAYDNILWTGHIPSPLHLELTSYAKIGVAVYAEDLLNNLFCAPNKIYEYTGFGIPTLCNDVPGLVETIGVSGAGLCVEWSDVTAIRDAIKRIMDNYAYFSKKALEFYASEDNKRILASIISEITTNNHDKDLRK